MYVDTFPEDCSLLPLILDYVYLSALMVTSRDSLSRIYFTLKVIQPVVLNSQ